MSEQPWFKGPEIDTDGGMYWACVNALYAVEPVVRRFPGTCWAMNLDWYKRIRAMGVTEEQETARALSHAKALIPVLAAFPLRCPACRAGPFATMEDLAGHAEAMADPANREPAPGDCLLGVPIAVTDDGGAPHIENRNYRPVDLDALLLPAVAHGACAALDTMASSASYSSRTCPQGTPGSLRSREGQPWTGR